MITACQGEAISHPLFVPHPLFARASPVSWSKKLANMSDKKTQRYSISVSSRTYDRLRTVVTGSLAGFVDDIVATAIDDPAILARVVARCRPQKETAT